MDDCWNEIPMPTEAEKDVAVEVISELLILFMA